MIDNIANHNTISHGKPSNNSRNSHVYANGLVLVSSKVFLKFIACCDPRSDFIHYSLRGLVQVKDCTESNISLLLFIFNEGVLFCSVRRRIPKIMLTHTRKRVGR